HSKCNVLNFFLRCVNVLGAQPRFVQKLIYVFSVLSESKMSTTTQCLGTTKSGKRCTYKVKTTYCRYHQPKESPPPPKEPPPKDVPSTKREGKKKIRGKVVK